MMDAIIRDAADYIGGIWYQNGEYVIYRHGDEPNPEVLSYWWPAYWWGAYVYDWHG